MLCLGVLTYRATGGPLAPAPVHPESEARQKPLSPEALLFMTDVTRGDADAMVVALVVRPVG